MNQPASKITLSFAEYLERERTSEIKHELVNGETFAMAGGTPEHARLASRVTGALLAMLHGRPCEVFSADLRLRVLATGLVTYPDISVVCGRFERDPEDANTLVNPVVLVEVLSDRTEAFDRGEKFAHYRRIPSLREYVLVSQRLPRIEVFQRSEKGAWMFHEAGAGESVELASIGCALGVDAVYVNALGDEVG